MKDYIHYSRVVNNDEPRGERTVPILSFAWPVVQGEMSDEIEEMMMQKWMTDLGL